VSFRLGNDYLENLCDFDVIFRAPGVYFLKEELTNARENGVVITSEIETFIELCPCKTYAITGSDGKTTTSTLISEILKAAKKKVFLGGNIGKALLPQIENISPDDVCVIELSSFQLLSIRHSPDVAVVTNISPNHLDVHKDMSEYINSKRNLLLHQNEFSKAVLNLDNHQTKLLRDDVRGKLCWFSIQKSCENGCFLDENENICIARKGEVEVLFNRREIKLPGMHNVENYLAAISAVSDEPDVTAQIIENVAKTFGGVEHRIEFVREIDGVKYYNDSIASSPTRTIAGLKSFEQKPIIIAGGYDKKIPYEPLAPVLVKHCKLLILIGATASKIKSAVINCKEFEENPLEIIMAGSLEEAVSIASARSKKGDIISLSPASASFDLYKNFEERG
ncbi:MAG: UDP-N-acetylmuramoyl-L-alanine--D-glutamate ligase, partial [Oscillospiraceae bacterium]